MLDINVGRVRELKGAPLAVLVLLAVSPRPVSQLWLMRSSGYSDKPVRMACEYLLEQGLINFSRSGWCLAAESRQLGGEPETDEVESETRNNSDSADDFENETQDNFDPQDDFAQRSEPGFRNNSDTHGAFLTGRETETRNHSAERGFPPIWSKPRSRKNCNAPGSIKLLSLKDLKDLKELKDFKDLKDFNTTSASKTNRKSPILKSSTARCRTSGKGRRRSRPDSARLVQASKSSQARAEIWAELSRIGLRKNARTEALVDLEHVTPDYVRALAEKLDQQGYGGFRHTGLFVKVCEQAEPVQAAPAVRASLHGKAVTDLVDQFLNRGR